MKFDGYMIEGATALWCAAAEGHMNVVKVLVENGGDVNHPTSTNSTPLRAACFDGRLDIVKYLIQNKADLHIANKYNNTCLMIASYKGHLEVVKFLLSAGAKPDEKAHCGATALHFASECGHLNIVKALLSYNAQILCNDFAVDPLQSAAESCHAEVVEYLCTLPGVTKEQRIDAYELLGASFANDKDKYDIQKSFKYLNAGMTERYVDSENIIKKDNLIKIPAYANRVECQKVAELEAIRYNHTALHMEALAIRERILGPNNPEVPHPIIFRGAVFADSGRFDRCIALWMHALALRQNMNRSIMKDLLRFAQVFSQMVHIGITVELNHVYEVLQHAILELELDRKRRTNAEDEIEREAVVEQLDENILTILYLLIIYNRIKKFKQEEELKLCKLVYKLVQEKPLMKDGSSLLHMAVNPATFVDDFHTDDVCFFPNVDLAKLLIKCGADVNAVNQNRNTPLHLIVSFREPAATELQSDFNVLYSIIELLISSGAHLDPCNNHGETPLQASVTGVAEVIIRTKMQLSLKCLAAKAVKLYNIGYEGSVPKNLESFIEMHGFPKDKRKHSEKIKFSPRPELKALSE